jgi:SET domain
LSETKQNIQPVRKRILRYRMKVPAGLEVSRSRLPVGGWGIIATAPFTESGVVFVGRKHTVEIPTNSPKLSEPIERLAVKYRDGSTAYLDVVPNMHCVPHDTCAKKTTTTSTSTTTHTTMPTTTFDVYGFDSFMNHSCDPNTTVVWLDADNYMHVALRNIAPGEEVTVSYDDVYYARAPHVMTCQCGARCCGGHQRYGLR